MLVGWLRVRGRGFDTFNLAGDTRNTSTFFAFFLFLFLGMVFAQQVACQSPGFLFY